MSDLESFRRDIGTQVLPPDFDEVVAVSRRRRLASVGWTAACVAAVVSVVSLGIQHGYGDSSAPVAPANPTRSPSGATHSAGTRTPTTTAANPTRQRLSPAQVVNGAYSKIAAVAVSHASPDVKAVAWQHCMDVHCVYLQFALTVTDDNFATSHDVALPGHFYPSVYQVSAHTFYATAGAQPLLVSTDGSVTAVRIDETARPLAKGEVFVGQARRASQNHVFLALNPVSAVAHPIPTQSGIGRANWYSMNQNDDGTLVGILSGFSSTWVMWSADGGATWQHHFLPMMGGEAHAIPSAASGQVLAAVTGNSQGAPGFPFDTVHRSIDRGKAWQTFDERHRVTAFLGWSLVDQNGSLLVEIDGWSDMRHGQPTAGHPVGLYESNGSDWSHLHYLQDLPAPGRAFVLGDYAATSHGYVRLWLYKSNVGLYEVGPGINAWQLEPAR